MKRWNYLILLLVAILPLVSSGSIGISPAYYERHFEPNLQENFTFKTFNYNKSEGVGIVLEGELSQYANLSDNNLLGGGRFTISLKLPEKFEKPGTHYLYIKIFESKNSTKNFEGRASIRVPIKILVPYPGDYTEATFKIDNINEGEDTTYYLDIQNLGTSNLTLDTYVEVFKANESGEKLLTAKLNDLTIETKKQLKIKDELDTNSFEPGVYFAKASIIYSKPEVLNTTFKIGQFLIDIIDYDFLFETGKINQFNILVENKWNTKIDSIYGDVTITKNGQVVSTFKTVSVDTKPWEVKNITGFFDAENLEPGRYLANINLHYGIDGETHKLVAIYLQDPPKGVNMIVYILIGVGTLSAIAIAALIFLLKRIKQLKEKLADGKKEKRKKIK